VTVAEDDDSDGYPNARIVYTAPRDGTYRIVAHVVRQNVGNYQLSVTRSNPPGRRR